jgi:hypothetical protein
LTVDLELLGAARLKEREQPTLFVRSGALPVLSDWQRLFSIVCKFDRHETVSGVARFLAI